MSQFRSPPRLYLYLAMLALVGASALYLFPARDTAARGAGVDRPGTPAGVPARVVAVTPSAPPTAVLSVTPRVAPLTPSADLFATNNWTPAPPAPAKPAPPPPPPPPTAPPVPFKFIGLLEAGDGTTAFLSAGDRLLLVKAGDTIEQVYRVESVGAKEIVLTYLPLKERQAIAVTATL